ncbi:hypothetical protein DDB_G0275047 [Dictyostelium discoideum AX4]|uniref:Uncharacterized protein n=1 Tax=Dictyostelium discoideum TaxID=44689 RepID=Q86I52_DICDI|nr:hypothetical protein DDB_G0275047 [Dictyostelium discoideum AX4]EAL69804.1 hypothetical protein DDB_G0275047 [Dictyostelium discoideum AX4]|eukprot:XP_643833.1 hypothetical protein DDB_G0275047 [Dictyostelium discoideum AX4]
MSENGFSPPLTTSLPPINLLANQLPNLNNNNNNNNITNENIFNKNYLNKCCNCKINNYNKRCKYRKRINNDLKELKDFLLNFIVELEKQKCTFQIIKDDINNYINDPILEEEEEEEEGDEENEKGIFNYKLILLELENEDLPEKLSIFKPIFDFIYQQIFEVSQSCNDLKLNIQLIEYQSFPKNKTSTLIDNLFLFPFSLFFYKINNFLKFIKNRLSFYFNSLLKNNLPNIRRK